MANHQFARLAAFILVTAPLGCADSSSQSIEPRIVAVAQTDRLNSWTAQKAVRSLGSTTLLTETTHRFILNPTDANRTAWQIAWVRAHDDWLTISYLLPFEETPSFQIDAWPIHAGFVDSLPEYPTSGIVNDITLELTEISVGLQHGFSDDAEVALGYHILEYFAYSRPMDDFLSGAENLDRRRRFTLLISEILLADMTAYTASLPARLPASNNRLIESIRARNQRMFNELTLLGQHSSFSGMSLANIATQLQTLNEILGSEVGTNHLLIELDTKLARTLNATIAEAINLMQQDGGPNEAESSRLVLLISAVTHQLEEFELLLTGR